jgi:hypothetical protein
MDCLAERSFEGVFFAMGTPALASPRLKHLHLVAGGTLPRKITEERSQFNTEEAFPLDPVNLMALTLGTDHFRSLREQVNWE